MTTELIDIEVEELSKDEAGMEDFFETTDADLDEFDEHSWNKGDGFKLPNFPEIESKLEGLESGMYLFAGESNAGKSAAMMNIMYDAATCEENNLFGIYFSLDDSKNEIIPRIISMNERIPISVSSKPQRYQNMIDNAEENSVVYEDWLQKRKNGLDKLKSQKELFKIVDGNTIKSGEQLYDYIKKVKRYLKTFAPDKKMIIAIDSINDIRFTSKKLAHGNEASSEAARVVKEWTVEFDIVILASCHLRKVNANRRAVLDDLKDSVEYVYESSVVWLVHNDVSKNKQAANIYYNVEGVDEKFPILELDWAKNKKSSYKGRTYNYFTPEYSLLSECPAETMRRFDALVYEA